MNDKLIESLKWLAGAEPEKYRYEVSEYGEPDMYSWKRPMGTWNLTSPDFLTQDDIDEILAGINMRWCPVENPDNPNECFASMVWIEDAVSTVKLTRFHVLGEDALWAIFPSKSAAAVAACEAAIQEYRKEKEG